MPKGLYKYVNAEEGLRMRADATLNSDIMTVIPWSVGVEILEVTEKSETIDGVRGSRNRVNWEKFSGWVFDGFLQSTR